MEEFSYVVQDKLGIHARPAGLLVKVAAGFASDVQIHKDEQQADSKRIFSLLGLCIKQGDEIRVTVEGADEVEAASALREFLAANL